MGKMSSRVVGYLLLIPWLFFLLIGTIWIGTFCF